MGFPASARPLGTLFLAERPPPTVSPQRSRAGYGTRALGVTYLPADAKGLCLALTQVARNDQDARVRPSCENRLSDITDSPPIPVAWGARLRAPSLKGGREPTRALMPLDVESIRIDGVTPGAYG